MRRAERDKERRRLEPSAAERLGAIVEAAERAAESVIDDAERQARRYLAEAQAEADQAVAERLGSLAELTDSLCEQAEAIRAHSEQLLAALEEARRELGAPERPQRAETGERVTHLSAVGSRPEPDPEPQPARNTVAGARLLAAQMAVSGSSREEIAARLRNGFEIEDANAILDAILGPED